MRYWITIFVLFISSFLSASEEPADLILYNGTIWTVDSTNPKAEAVAILKDKIVAVGSNSAVLARQGERTRKIDLQKAFVVPGFNDNHVHFASAAKFLEFNIMKVTTQADFVNRIKELIASLPEGEWITGGYWGAYDQWTEDSAGGKHREAFTPDLSLISDITRNYPIFIRKFDDSEFAANGTALREGRNRSSESKEGRN